MKTLALLALLSSLTIATDTEGYIRFYNLPGYESEMKFSGVIFIDNLPPVQHIVRFTIYGEFGTYDGTLPYINGSMYKEINTESKKTSNS